MSANMLCITLPHYNNEEAPDAERDARKRGPPPPLTASMLTQMFLAAHFARYNNIGGPGCRLGFQCQRKRLLKLSFCDAIALNLVINTIHQTVQTFKTKMYEMFLRQ